MYNSFFGLTETPFNLTPDPRYLYLSSNHREAIDHLLYGINERKGFILITGGIGAGKTTLCRVLLDRLDEKTKSALILNSFISDMELLKLIVQEFGVDIDTNAGREITKKDYVDALNRFLLTNFSNGGNAVLLIDEAQNLSREVLEQLRMLSNLETEREKLIQIVLIGQPELNDIIGAPSLRQLNDRILVRYFLKPLGDMDVKGYVEHRLVVAGSHGNITFTSGAYKRLYSRSEGIPRRINSICDRSLLIAYTKGAYTVTGTIIDKAANDLYGAGDVIKKGGLFSWVRPLHIILIAFILLVAAGITGFIYLKHMYEVSLSRQVKEVVAAQKKEETPVVKEVKKEAELYLDSANSISALFSLFYRNNPDKKINDAGGRLSLETFELAPEYYITLKKPFVLKTNRDMTNIKYLLITGVNENGARCSDAEGNEREISKEFLFENWGGSVSWIFPVYARDQIYNIGMEGPAISRFQKTLQSKGYLVQVNGIYDITTLNEMKRFQGDFGLRVDGVAGPRTNALLYQMAE
ncbi:MAG: AAA family ATPase [Deltaproteobacteria bacterium]|nr:AAA family ATPase [Deltaproteobacteria bacterium]